MDVDSWLNDYLRKKLLWGSNKKGARCCEQAAVIEAEPTKQLQSEIYLRAEA